MRDSIIMYNVCTLLTVHSTGEGKTQIRVIDRWLVLTRVITIIVMMEQILFVFPSLFVCLD